MKKIALVLASAILTVFLTLFFFLTPSQIISEINSLQRAVVFSAGRSGGNFVTGYSFAKAAIARNDGTQLLVLDEATLDLHMLPLLFGRLGIGVRSKEITADISAGFDGSVDGEVIFTSVAFDTTAFIPPESISFTAPVSGRVILSGRNADIEVRADEITWRRLLVAGFELPPDIFAKGKGGISVGGDRTIVKSVAFEGAKGYARLSGEISRGKQNLTLELFPRDWGDFMLIPLERYKVSPGQYRMPLNF